VRPINDDPYEHSIGRPRWIHKSFSSVRFPTHCMMHIHSSFKYFFQVCFIYLVLSKRQIYPLGLIELLRRVNMADDCRRFVGICCLHLQGRRVYCKWMCVLYIGSVLKMRQYLLPKCHKPIQSPYGPLIKKKNKYQPWKPKISNSNTSSLLALQPCVDLGLLGPPLEIS
jgi:hypothetical protein